MTSNYYEKDFLSFSKLFLLNDTAKHFTWLKDNKKSTKAMDFGNLVHTMLLEKHLVDERYIVESEIIIPTKVKKKKPTKKELKENPELQDWYETEEFEDIPLNRRLKEHQLYMESYTGKIVVSDDDFELATSMIKSVNNDFESSLILAQSIGFEKEYFYEFEGVAMKSKIDIVGEDFLGDLKTIQGGKLSNIRQLYWTIVSRGYDIQAALYTYASGLPIKNYKLIFVEKSPPFAVRIVTLNEEDLQYGWNKFLILFNKYKDYKAGKLNKDTGYPSVNFSEMVI